MTWETMNLNISTPRQKLKIWYTKFSGRYYFIQHTNYLLSSIETQGGNPSDRQTDIMGSEVSEPYIKILNSTCSLAEIMDLRKPFLSDTLSIS